MNPAPITFRADCTDTELNAAVAEHVAGWTQIGFPKSGILLPRIHGFPPNPGDILNPVEVPQYATDANAVLPLLEKHSRREVNFVGDAKWKDRAYAADLNGYKAMAPTFCRAACFALLRAAGVTVEE